MPARSRPPPSLPSGDLLRATLAAIDPEPVIALLEPLCTPPRRARLHAVLSARLGSVTLVMDAPHDPHNGAAVLRSCDAFGVGRVHVVERRERFAAAGSVARGAERWVEVIDHPSAAEAVAAVSGFTLVSTHPAGELLPAELARVPRLALVMGNEHDGICQELQQACALRVRVPMRGFVESLNLSVAAATLLAYATERRPGDISDSDRRRLYARWLALSVPRAPDILAARGIGAS